MARKDRRRQPPQRRTTSRPTRDPHVAPQNAEDQELFQTIRRALRSDEPIDLLALTSSLLEVTDPRSANPFDRHEQRPVRADLVESMVGTPYAETTALLTVLRALVDDADLRVTLDRELAHRRHPLPRWLAEIDRTRLEPDVWFLTHVLGDGDDYLVGVVLPGGEPLSALIYVDHNMGTIVKDAFVVPEPLEDLMLRLGTMLEDPDQVLTRADPATARATVEAAIAHGARLYPPATSDDWPASRPLVEWMLRMLPEGGVAPERHEWTEKEQAALLDDFFASRYGAPLDTPDARGLAEDLVWFGTSYATGDPLRWSPVTVEMLLADWFPRKVVADARYLAQLPGLLRAFVRWAHAREEIRDELTRETLAAVDHWEPEYQRLIRSARPQGPAALAARMLDQIGLNELEIERLGDLSLPEYALEGLDRTVGDRMALQALDDEPLPDEPFEWAGVPDDVRASVQEVLDHCDRCADELFDVEHRTAMRRFLSRAAVGDPAIFRRRASRVKAAAAIAWVIGKANGTVASGRGMTTKSLEEWFGEKGFNQRAETMLKANGVNPFHMYGGMYLGSPDLLTGARRRTIIDERDRWLAELED